MRWSVEQHDPEPVCQERSGQSAETPGAAAPTVCEDYDRALTPDPRGKLVLLASHGEAITGREKSLFRWTGVVARRAAEDGLRPACGDARGHGPNGTKRGAKHPERRSGSHLGLRGDDTPEYARNWQVAQRVR